MIELQKCIKNEGCIMITLDCHVSLMTEEEQKHFIYRSGVMRGTGRPLPLGRG
jgi:hypothetical protein